MTMLGFAELEAEEDIGVAELLPAPSVSLSLALSAMAVRQCGAEEGGGGQQLQILRQAKSAKIKKNACPNVYDQIRLEKLH